VVLTAFLFAIQPLRRASVPRDRIGRFTPHLCSSLTVPHHRRMPLHEALHRLDTALATHRADSLAELSPPIDEAALGRLAKSLERDVPADVAALLRWHDGAPSGARELVDNWQLLGSKEIGAASKTLRKHLAAGEFDDKLDWWSVEWIPLFGDGGGNYLCFDAAGSFGGQAGQLLRFVHDHDSRAIVAPSLEAWLVAVASAIESGADEAAPIDGYPKAAAARKNDVKAKARISVRDAIKAAIDPLGGPRAGLAIPIDADRVVKAAKLTVEDESRTLLKRRDTAVVQVFEVLPAPGAKKVAYAVWSTSTVGDGWKDGFVVGVDLKGDTVLKEKKVQG